MSIKSGSAAQFDSLHRVMSQAISDRVKATADWPTPIPGLLFFRRDECSEPCACLVEPSVVLVVQGTKTMLIGGHSYPYNTENFLITSLDIPAHSQVTQASEQEPCLGLVLKLDIRTLSELITEGGLPPAAGKRVGQSVGLGTVTHTILQPLKRLLDLLDEPEAIPALAPLIQREIHFRLLQSDQASLLRQIASIDSHSHRIGKAIDWLKRNYHTSLRVEELAAQVQMSAPTFHHHFRQLTEMSPLQYQKWLRLNEANRLMINEHLDASSAGFKVGYESPSQFSREYSRLFGLPPKRHIETLRQQMT
jgi:AraC-like DNA-binding protein